MSGYLRNAGEVHPRIPSSAPLAYRLSQRVYALDGCMTGPAVGANASHVHEVRCETGKTLGHRHSLSGTPEDVRRLGIIGEIKKQRQQGKTDQQIREYLLQPRGLPHMHPCAGPQGENLCTPTEVDARFVEASAMAQAKKRAVVPYIALAGVVLILMFAGRRQR